jgi:Uma2 family endonuclease
MELVVFRDPQNTGYQSQEIFTEGEIRPLAFSDVKVSVQRLLGI